MQELMGKRKERRLAAMGNTGRRFKLDLFAEPSGELGGSIVHDEVGGDPKVTAGLPNSPSSSGEQPQNPLLLLGQYSDDDVDEELDKRLNHAIIGSPSVINDAQVEEPPAEGCKEKDAKADESHAVQKIDQQHIERDSILQDVYVRQEADDTRETDSTGPGYPCKEMCHTPQNSAPGISEFQMNGDVSSSWKMVMHEETNQYYYWNTETGETSWEIPAIFAQSTELVLDHKAALTRNEEDAPVDTHDTGSGLGDELENSSAAQSSSLGCANLIAQSEVYGDGPLTAAELTGEHKTETLKDETLVPSVNKIENQSSLDTVNVVLDNPVIDELASIKDKTGIDLSTYLVTRSESLLERLKSLKGSEGHLQAHGWMSKYMLEVEIRLSDFKALISHGSSLLPFWVHSEKQLKRLEEAINDEIYQLAKSAVMDEVEETHMSTSVGKDKSHESMNNESEAEGNKTSVLSSPEIHNLSTEEGSRGNVVSPIGLLGSEDTVGELHVTAPDERSPMCGFDGEDVDMDVDMEIEEAVPAGNAANGIDIKPQEPSNLPAGNPSLVLNDDSTVLPPLDEEWNPPPPPDNEQIPPPPPDNEHIPPPPPDNDQVPPPPPDELQELSHPLLPSYMETGQPVTYAEQYHLAYLDPNIQYYGHSVANVSTSNFYVHADGSQVAVPNASLYYGMIPNTYGETANAVVNAVQPVAYYDFKEGGVLPVIVDGNAESSQFHKDSAPVSYSVVTLESADSTTITRPRMKVDISTAGGGNEIEAATILSTSATIQASATVSVKESVTSESTNVVSTSAAGGTASSAKVHSKVLRGKKRTVAVAPSLRSNKKVSGLVDKWKAAKEELNENEDDEPENLYEVLERKRQREIEEWRAKQIASGEAKDNANFQPLGGDWRERVKRRRAQAARETAQTAPEARSNENQQPDLVELSRGLLSGWQAYWDETSKQVYYGNPITSETTWIKPSK